MNSDRNEKKRRLILRNLPPNYPINIFLQIFFRIQYDGDGFGNVAGNANHKSGKGTGVGSTGSGTTIGFHLRESSAGIASNTLQQSGSNKSHAGNQDTKVTSNIRNSSTSNQAKNDIADGNSNVANNSKFSRANIVNNADFTKHENQLNQVGHVNLSSQTNAETSNITQAGNLESFKNSVNISTLPLNSSLQAQLKERNVYDFELVYPPTYAEAAHSFNRSSFATITFTSKQACLDFFDKYQYKKIEWMDRGKDRIYTVFIEYAPLQILKSKELVSNLSGKIDTDKDFLNWLADNQKPIQMRAYAENWQSDDEEIEQSLHKKGSFAPEKKSDSKQKNSRSKKQETESERGDKSSDAKTKSNNERKKDTKKNLNEERKQDKFTSKLAITIVTPQTKEISQKKSNKNLQENNATVDISAKPDLQNQVVKNATTPQTQPLKDHKSQTSNKQAKQSKKGSSQSTKKSSEKVQNDSITSPKADKQTVMVQPSKQEKTQKRKAPRKPVPTPAKSQITIEGLDEITIVPSTKSRSTPVTSAYYLGCEDIIEMVPSQTMQTTQSSQSNPEHKKSQKKRKGQNRKKPPVKDVKL